MPEIPFAWRVFALLIAMVLFVGLDLRKPSIERHRWREWTFLLVAATASGMVGLCVDLVTSNISPEYFSLGKGIAEGPGFSCRVAKLGASAGFSAGAIGAALVLLANPAPERSLFLFRLLWLPLLPALGFAILAGGLVTVVPSMTYSAAAEALGSVQAQRFTIAWVSHIGAYVGGGIGLLLLVWKLRYDSMRTLLRERKLER